MHTRWLLFLALVVGHLTLVSAPPENLAPPIAGSVYLPLMLFSAMGLPVFAIADGGGWQAPSMLGWAVVAFVWLAIWWGTASLLSLCWTRAKTRANQK